MAEAERRRADTVGEKEREQGEANNSGSRIEYVSYKDETQLPDIMALIDQELSEPYSIFTYRYFITLWPDLCFMVSSLSSWYNCLEPNPNLRKFTIGAVKTLVQCTRRKFCYNCLERNPNLRKFIIGAVKTMVQCTR